MEGWLPIFFLMVILKIPVGFLLYIVWWAFRAEGSYEEEAVDDDGGDHRHRRFRRTPKRPRGPRRGPHAPDVIRPPAGRHEGRSRNYTPPAPARGAGAATRGTQRY